ncbi:MAG: tail fiber domain-containing protein [Bacteroidetes bacterium]|nr:tail fiber domain-containing protein [Bacteroidota bacterium]
MIKLNKLSIVAANIILMLIITDYVNAQQQGNQPFWRLTGNSISTGDFIGTTNSEEFRFRTSNMQRMVIDASGNVGIGIASPTAKLHTVATGMKTIDYTGNLMINSASSSTSSITKAGLEILSTGTWNGTGSRNIGLYISSVTGGSINFDAIFNGGGNVGIGTTDPTERLDIDGQVRIRGGSPILGRVLASDADGVGSWIAPADLDFDDGDWTIVGTNMHSSVTGNVGIGAISPSEKLEVNGNIEIDRSSGTSNAQLHIVTDTETWSLLNYGSGGITPGRFSIIGAGANKLTIENNTGNVGIGTLTPMEKLDLDSAAITVNGRDNTGEFYPGMRPFGTGRLDVGWGGKGGANVELYSKGHSTLPNKIKFIYGEQDTGSVEFVHYDGANNWTEMARLDKRGFFGLGVRPRFKLDVGGDINLTGALRASDDGGINGQVLKSTGSGIEWVNFKSLDGDWTVTGNNMYSSVSGNVGIGHMNPQGKLHVHGGSGYFSDFVVKPNGNVGMGTLSPANNLHIKGNGETNFLIEVGSGPPARSTRIKLYPRTNGIAALQGLNGVMNLSSVGDIVFGLGRNGTMDGGYKEKVRIKKNGKFGIGTAHPQQKLHVIGNIYASGTITQLSDRNFKGEIKTLNNSLENILQLRGVNYYMKANEFPEFEFSTRKQIGFIAQEVEEILPELVITHEDGYKSLDYMKITPILVEAIKEQQTIIKDQLTKVNDQVKKLYEQRQELDELKDEVKSQKGIIETQSSKAEQQQGEINELRDNIVLIKKSLLHLSNCCDRAPAIYQEGVEETDDHVETILHQNVPNPFDRTTIITYRLARPGQVILNIYTENEIEVATLTNEYQEAGEYSLTWDGSDHPAGVYIYTLKQDDILLSKKMMLLK